MAIVILLLGFFATFYRDMLLKGKIYFPKLPKYLAVNAKAERKFIYTQAEKDALSGKWDVSLIKGLGQMSPQELAIFTTNKSSRNLVPVQVDEDSFEDFYSSLEVALSKDKESVGIRREMLIS